MAADKSLRLAFILSATDKMSRVVDQAVKKSSSKLTAFERTTGKIGQSMAKAGGIMTGVGAAIGATAFGIAKSTANYGDEVIKTSQKAGIGVDEWQKLSYAARNVNVDSNQLTSAMGGFNKKITEAANGSATAGQVFKDLGIKLKDASGNLRAPNEVLEELSDVFATVKDGASKSALAVELFGGSGVNLIPLLNKGKNGLKALGDEAERTGNVMSEDAARAGEKFNNDLIRLKEGAKGVTMQLGTALMPMFTQLIEKINGVVGKVANWIKENPKLVGTISKIAMILAGLLVTVGTASVVIGGIIAVVGKVAAVFKGVMAVVKVATGIVKLFNITLLANPAVWIIAAIVAIGAAVYLLIKHWSKVMAFFAKLWNGIKKIFSKAWEWIKGLFLNYTPTGLIIKHWSKISGWFSRLWDGVKNVFSKAWEWIKGLFLNYTPTGLIIKHWSKISGWFSRLWDGVKNVFSKAWEWIKGLFLNYTPTGLIIKHWSKISGWFSRLWDGVKNVFSKAWEWIKGLFLNYTPTGLIIKHWDKLVGWFTGLWDGVKAVFVNAWSGIGEFFDGLGARFYEWGSSLITGLWNGIKSVAKKAVDGVKNVGKSIANGFKSFFGINSPSRLFMEYGVNITQGLAGGIMQGEDTVEGATQGLATQANDGFEQSIGGRAAQVNEGFAQSIQTNSVDASQAANNVGGASINYSPNITINGAVEADVKKDFLQMLREHRDEIVNIIEREQQNKTRLSFN